MFGQHGNPLIDVDGLTIRFAIRVLITDDCKGTNGQAA